MLTGAMSFDETKSKVKKKINFEFVEVKMPHTQSQFSRNAVCIAMWPWTLGATSPWDLPSCLTSVDLTTARMLLPSRIAALLVLRMKPAATSDGIYLVRELRNELYRDPVVDVPISFVCKCSTTRVAWSHLLSGQKPMITVRWGKKHTKSHLPKCTRSVIKRKEIR